MQMRFAAARPHGSYDLALVAPQNGEVAGLPSAHAGLARDAMRAARFEGEAGSIVELFVQDDGATRRLLIVGTGKGEPADYEKAGGALVARLLTSGTETLVVDLAGANVSADVASRLATAAALRAWRIDTYRTKLPPKQQATLKEFVVVGADGKGWEDQRAVVEGVALTREL